MSHKRNLNKIIAFLSLIFLPVCIFALASDAHKAIQFSSKSASYNYKNHIIIFVGDVKMSQGSTLLTADKMTIYRTPEGQIKKVLAIGKLAHYQTLPDNDKRMMKAKAKQIEYYPKKALAILTGDASVAQGKNIIHARRIVYNMEQQSVMTTPYNNSRIKIVLNPTNPPKGSGLNKNKPL